ncbi:MAG: hypothetical protein Q4G35_08220 [Propionibacteriaceae bacterium]|nr:hypothetical protein [Propionibacteriaceae bacterium]
MQIRIPLLVGAVLALATAVSWSYMLLLFAFGPWADPPWTDQIFAVLWFGGLLALAVHAWRVWGGLRSQAVLWGTAAALMVLSPTWSVFRQTVEGETVIHHVSWIFPRLADGTFQYPALLASLGVLAGLAFLHLRYKESRVISAVGFLLPLPLWAGAAVFGSAALDVTVVPLAMSLVAGLCALLMDRVEHCSKRVLR